MQACLTALMTFGSKGGTSPTSLALPTLPFYQAGAGASPFITGISVWCDEMAATPFVACLVVVAVGNAR